MKFKITPEIAYKVIYRYPECPIHDGLFENIWSDHLFGDDELGEKLYDLFHKPEYQKVIEEWEEDQYDGEYVVVTFNTSMTRPSDIIHAIGNEIAEIFSVLFVIMNCQGSLPWSFVLINYGLVA